MSSCESKILVESDILKQFPRAGIIFEDEKESHPSISVSLVPTIFSLDNERAFEVRAYHSKSDHNPTVIRCQLLLDTEGNVVGLDKNRLLVWYHDLDSAASYVLEYRIIPEHPACASLDFVAKKDRHDSDYHEQAKGSETFAVPKTLPQNIDLAKTLSMYLTGLETLDGPQLSARQILNSPLIPIQSQ